MRYLLLLLLCSISFGITQNKAFRVAPGKTVGSWGPINLADPVNAVSNGSPVPIKNATISASVAANALTLRIKVQDGSTDPSANVPVSIPFRSTTLTSGQYVDRQITSALSVVVSAGSTLGHASATLSTVYVYALDNAGTVELAVSNSTFDENKLQTTVAEGGAGAADSPSVLYSTTARTNVAVRLISALQVTESTAGNWATAPSLVSNSFINPISGAQLRQQGGTVGVAGVTNSSSDTSIVGITALTDIPGATVTITTTGRPVLVVFGADKFTGINSMVDMEVSTGGGVERDISIGGTIELDRDSAAARWSWEILWQTRSFSLGQFTTRAPYGFTVVDNPAAGTHTYKARYSITSIVGTTLFRVRTMSISAIEL